MKNLKYPLFLLSICFSGMLMNVTAASQAVDDHETAFSLTDAMKDSLQKLTATLQQCHMHELTQPLAQFVDRLAQFDAAVNPEGRTNYEKYAAVTKQFMILSDTLHAITSKTSTLQRRDFHGIQKAAYLCRRALADLKQTNAELQSDAAVQYLGELALFLMQTMHIAGKKMVSPTVIEQLKNNALVLSIGAGIIGCLIAYKVGNSAKSEELGKAQSALAQATKSLAEITSAKQTLVADFETYKREAQQREQALEKNIKTFTDLVQDVSPHSTRSPARSIPQASPRRPANEQPAQSNAASSGTPPLMTVGSPSLFPAPHLSMGDRSRASSLSESIAVLPQTPSAIAESATAAKSRRTSAATPGSRVSGGSYRARGSVVSNVSNVSDASCVYGTDDEEEYERQLNEKVEEDERRSADLERLRSLSAVLAAAPTAAAESTERKSFDSTTSPEPLDKQHFNLPPPPSGVVVSSPNKGGRRVRKPVLPPKKSSAQPIEDSSIMVKTGKPWAAIKEKLIAYQSTTDASAEKDDHS